ncbi:MAG: AbrB/MazE/SpoVT family DNA-binding protein [Hydrocarboniphaga sp.]|uniref:AbrB/MazE/SpoVT family DNA-binding domain-containing protein n=1 Tax=Hydrocarboniphaga sp. TaxID=2033016 RepID=UPI002605610F|nr:AbrB/MazE/SpoVT family DNA-binding domain-containing protein [Hydrocarboniphaga sp.]MDB5971834.1 AbrB/MazE/SpoVT family DNA-binding protein [Hydrocarboniphaga sp.]
MTTTISMDASGRLVLPKAIRQRLNLQGGARLQASVVAGHLELIPVSDEEQPAVVRKSGLMVLAATGKPVDAAAAVAAERGDQEARGTRR